MKYFVRPAEVTTFFPRFTFSPFLSRAREKPTSTRSKSLEKSYGKDSRALLIQRSWLSSTPPKTCSSASRLDGELLQVLIIGDVGSDGIADDIGGLFAISLLPLGVELLVGLGDFLLRRY
jgi:hypothetical protein